MRGEGAAAKLAPRLRPGTLAFFETKAEPRFLLDQRLKTDPTGEVEILRKAGSLAAGSSGMSQNGDVMFLMEYRFR